MTSNKFRRGQVWWVNDTSTNDQLKFCGNLQAKSRPWLIISNNACNANSPVLTCCPLTTRADDGFISHISFNDESGKHQLLMVEQITSKNVSDFERYMFSLDDELMHQVDRLLQLQLNVEGITSEKLETTFDLLLERLKTEIMNAKQDNTFIEQVIEKKIGGMMNVVSTVKNNGIRSTVIAPKSSTIKKSVDKIEKFGRIKWTDELKAQFIVDYDQLQFEDLSAKYGIDKKSTACNYVCTFRKQLGEKK